MKVIQMDDTAKKGRLYGIGVGPGDPELITLKAVNILKTLDVIAVPESRKGKGSIAMDIAEKFIHHSAEVLVLTFPMTTDELLKEKSRYDNAMIIKEKVMEGKSVGFLTLGDPLLYSTYIYILDHLKDADISIETVPGVPAFCAVGARLNLPLAQQDQTLGILPLNKDADIDIFLKSVDNAVVMKVSAHSEKLYEILVQSEDNYRVYTVSDCGTDQEKVYETIDFLNDDIPYLTTSVIKKNKGK